MRRMVLALVAIWGTVACTTPDTELLDAPRIVWIGTEPPALVAPGAATLTVKAFDPEFRVPLVQWYIIIDLDLQSQAALASDLRDPDAVDLSALGLFYLGSGTQVTALVPRLQDVADFDPDVLRDEALLDTVPVPILVSVSWGDNEVKGLKQLRVVIPELVPAVLARRLGRTPSEAEVQSAIALRLNRNPTITAVTMAVVPDSGVYDLDPIFDLRDRRALAQRQVTLPTGFSRKQAIRLWPTIVDPDVDANKRPGDPGFNQIELNVLPTLGSVYPLSLSAADWAPHELKQGSIFSEPKIKTMAAALERLELTVIDRQGGTANVGLELDGGAPPPVTAQGAAGSLLLAEGRRLLWLRTESEATRAAVPGAPIAVSATLWALPLAPHGLAGTATAVLPTTAATPPTRHLDRYDLDPAARAAATAVTLRGRVVRYWP